MKKIILSFTVSIMFACNGNDKKEKAIEILKNEIGQSLPFDDVKIAEVENGTGVIVDGIWCYWISSDNKLYCVNGASKSIYNSVNEIDCKDAPINSGYLDILKIAK